ncbi:hypothetical protein HUN07_02815 [Rhodococcus sp. W8901]|nr:hypothetical protein HUN07_02815 [Rhodococcus sp. W8901]
MSAVLVRIRPMVLSFCRSRMQGMRYPSLSAQQRTILHLRIIDGRTATDTADALGMTPGAVRVAQHRALARLREEFATNSRNTKSRNA